jgi:hypothetical protein
MKHVLWGRVWGCVCVRGWGAVWNCFDGIRRSCAAYWSEQLITGMQVKLFRAQGTECLGLDWGTAHLQMQVECNEPQGTIGLAYGDEGSKFLSNVTGS